MWQPRWSRRMIGERNGSLTAGFQWILAGTLSSAAANWGAVVLMARFGDPETLGAYALGLSMASIAFSLSGLELRTLQVTQQTEDPPFSAYFGLRLATSLAALAVLSLLALRESEFTALAVIVVSTGRAFDALSDILYARFQVLNCLHRIGISQILRASLSLLLLSLALSMSMAPLAAVAAVPVANLCVFLLYDLACIMRYGRSIEVRGAASPGQVLALVRAGLPFAAISMMVAAIAALPRLTIAREAGPASVAVVAALSYLAIAPNLLVTSLGQAGMRSLATSFAAGDSRAALAGATRLFMMSAAVGCTALGAALLGGAQILRVIYGARYAGYERELALFLGAGAIGYLNAGLGYCLSSARITAPQIPMMATVCVVTFGACTIFIRHWGVAGAAVGQAAGMLLQLTWSAAVFARRFRAPLAQREALSPL
jgi:O-antigen/teichoic acid export membrane protein